MSASTQAVAMTHTLDCAEAPLFRESRLRGRVGRLAGVQIYQRRAPLRGGSRYLRAENLNTAVLRASRGLTKFRFSSFFFFVFFSSASLVS